ncbi:hypothetical protein H5407_02535 [Mitsuaria sp. WAJ17]|uniref:hypothetical protein n=1 Tax=Mitsuaria sp. WAJ17 TaxID=2761452 RepID=UPI0016035A0C|nr:hypothetical protein [Mitsuaria sp. WAJ17]MBB2484095.1 hypothetical protein [Mitsuaria sp. WAJ17]
MSKNKSGCGGRRSLGVGAACLATCGLAMNALAEVPNAAVPATAASAVPELVLAPVAVQGKRAPDPAIMPAKFIYLIDGVARKHASELIRLDFKAHASKQKLPAPGTRLVVELDNEEELPVGMAEDGTLSLPPLTPAQSETAKLIPNQPKGSMGLRLSLEVIPKVGSLTPEQVGRADAQLRSLVGDIKGLLPWAFRWMLPGVSGVALCQPAGEVPAVWASSSGTRRITFLYESKDRKQSCAVLDPAGLPADARLQAPAGATLGPWINGLTGTKSR